MTNNQHGAVFSTLLEHGYFYPGGDGGGLQLLPGLSDWPAILGSGSRLLGSRSGLLPARFHAAAVFLLRWLVEGEVQVSPMAARGALVALSLLSCTVLCSYPGSWLSGG